MTNETKRISLFLPCLADLFYPSIGVASIRVLKTAGLDVVYPPDQTCCGQWAYNMGRKEAARKLARHFLRVFSDAHAIVSPSGSCVLTVKNHYPELFEHEPRWRNKAELIGGRVFELSDFLVNVIGRTDLGAALNVRATLHDSCHPLRGLGLKSEPRKLLERVGGLELLEMEDPEHCCGFGGAFMAKHPSLSQTMAEDKVRQAEKTGAKILIMTEPGCLLNVQSAAKGRGSSIKAVHLAEVLAGSVEVDHV